MATIYQLFKAFTGSLDDGAHIDIRRAGRIKQAHFELQADLDADSELAYAELSMSAANQADVNDARDVLGIAKLAISGATDAGSVRKDKTIILPLDVAVQAGDRLYLHAVLAGTASLNATILIHVAD